METWAGEAEFHPAPQILSVIQELESVQDLDVMDSGGVQNSKNVGGELSQEPSLSLTHQSS